MKVRLIRTQAFDAHTNMALDEVISQKVREGTSPPTIRLYTWNPSAISIGYFQGLHHEVDITSCKEQEIDIVRRRTGGGAVYHDREGELTYSCIFPEDVFSPSIQTSYEEICNFIIEALAKLAIPCEFKPINDILCRDKKISGNAQTRREGILLQHGTILYKVDVETMFSLLKVGKEKISDKLIQSVKKRVTSVYDQNPDLTLEDIAQSLEEVFSSKFSVEIGDYTEEELEEAKELARNKYSTEEWNAQF